MNRNSPKQKWGKKSTGTLGGVAKGGKAKNKNKVKNYIKPLVRIKPKRNPIAFNVRKGV